MLVKLTKTEFDAAASLGVKRQELRVKRGRSEPEYQDRGGTHVERNAIGGVSEYALAKALGPDALRDWVENKAYSEEHWKIKADVGRNLHVRSTKLGHGGLVLHPYDPDDGLFVLAIVDGLTVKFVGTILGRDGKTDQHWRDTGPGFGLRPAFCVKQSFLKPFDVETVKEHL